MEQSRLQVAIRNCLSVTTSSRALHFGHCTCIAVQLLYNQRFFLVSSSNNIVFICTLVDPIKYWWKIQSFLDSGLDIFFSPWSKPICDLFPHKAMWWIFCNIVSISNQHLGNYNKREFTEFLDIIHTHHKIHDAFTIQ